MLAGPHGSLARESGRSFLRDALAQLELVLRRTTEHEETTPETRSGQAGGRRQIRSMLGIGGSFGFRTISWFF